MTYIAESSVFYSVVRKIIITPKHNNYGFYNDNDDADDNDDVS